jgi:FtsZ-interacting cell division protein ZipA
MQQLDLFVNFREILFIFINNLIMSGLRKSTRIRKPITTIDQNLDDDDEDAFITLNPKKSTGRVSNKRPSTDDNAEQEMITPSKRQKKKPSTTTTTKTSPYFNTKSVEKKADSPIKKQKKTVKPKDKKKNEKARISIDENTTLSNDATSVTTKSKSN